MPYRKTGLLPLLFAFIMCGCIKENQDDCPVTGYSLVFYYPGNGEFDIFPSRVDHVNMFIYDVGGALVLDSGITRGELASFQGFRPELPDGDYTVVCWGNADGYSRFTETDPIGEGRLYQAQFMGGETIENFDSLYFGRGNIRIDNRINHTDTLRFSSAHINMEVHIEGYEGRITTRSRGQGIIEVDNISVGYDFGMNLTPETSVMYPLWENDQTDTEIISGFNLLRFRNDNGIVVNVRDSDEGGIIGTVVLADFLAENNIDVEDMNEITVPIYIIFDEFGMRVSVDPWNTSPITPAS